MTDMPRFEDTIPSIYVQRPPRLDPGSDYFRRMDAQTQRAIEEVKDRPPTSLSSPEATRLFESLMGHATHEMERQAENRRAMAEDEDMFDHKHWTLDELQVLEQRGQAPLVFNLTQTAVNWVLGTQRRATMDYKILPRRKDGRQAAQLKTDLLKHIADLNRSEYSYSAAFADAVKAGIGWLETGQGQEDDGVLVYDRHESWRSILWDSTALRYDLSDARYIYRSKWMDLDQAAMIFPERVDVLKLAANQLTMGASGLTGIGDEVMDEREEAYAQTMGIYGNLAQNSPYGVNRPRVRAIEMWFKRVLPDAAVMSGGQFTGELFDEWSTGHWDELKAGTAKVVIRPREVVHQAFLCESGLLSVRQSPYRHNRYPFTPVWGYRRASDGLPYGLIRGIRDINRDLNKRASKSLHILSSKTILAPKGSLEDVEVARNEAARPDSVIEFDPVAGVPSILTDTNLAAAHMEMLSRDAQMIQQVAGITDENLGRHTNANSGKAIIARQEQGALSTSHFFDNLRQSRAAHGEKLLVNTEQFYTKHDEFRISDVRGKLDFRTINEPGKPEHSIAASKADFVVGEQEWAATQRAAESEVLMSVIQQLATTTPELVAQALDIIVETLDVPYREELVKRIRNITGAADPDEDPENPSEETLQRRAAADAKAKLEKAAMELQAAEAMAKVRKLNAEAAKLETGITQAQIDAIASAVAAALQLAQVPQVSPMADRVLAQATGQAQQLQAEAEAKTQGQIAAATQTPAPQMTQAPATPAMM